MKFFYYLFSLVLLPVMLFAAINRPFEPVVLRGSDLYAFAVGHDVPVGNIICLAYVDSKWKYIPYQIDERADDWPYSYFEGNDALFDGNDELAFMAHDAGEKIPDWLWVGDPTSQQYPRIEIRIDDPLTGDAGYVYAFRTDNPAVYQPHLDALPDYIQALPAEDRVVSDFYQLSHDNSGAGNGNIENILIPTTANGGGLDFVDRMKFRAIGKVTVGGITVTLNEPITEENLVRSRTPNYRDGLVRVLRRWNIKISIKTPIGDFTTPDEYSFVSVFYPAWCDFGQETINLGDAAELNYVRYSFDLDSDANGMKMFSSISSGWETTFPNGVPIDMAHDSGVLPRTLAGGALNWWMQTGTPGTMLTVALIPQIGACQELYYKDAASGTNDAPCGGSGYNWPDTGDQPGSWGDTGVKFSSPPVIGGELPLKAQIYLLGDGVDSDSAASIMNTVANPCNIDTSSYIVPVELALFDISSYKNRVTLTWSTATETNNLGFRVERRLADSETFEKIGFVNGAGTTTKQQYYSFQDLAGAAGTIYYRLKQIDTDGSFEYFESSVVVDAPDRFALAQNFPNPFNPSTTIGYEIAGDGDLVSIDVYDMLGRHVRSLVEEKANAGYHTTFWDGRDKNGKIAGSGVYICVLTCGPTRITKKMVKLQ